MVTPPSPSDRSVRAQLRAQVRARLRAAADDLAQQRQTGRTRVSLVERVEALGFGVETAEVFDLLPLIHIAWADGEVQESEREAILRVLDARGIEARTKARVLVASLLEQHPGQSYMDETLAILREILGKNAPRATALVDLCVLVARAHGAGPHGLDDPIDPRERQALQEVAAALGDRAQAWLATTLVR